MIKAVIFDCFGVLYSRSRADFFAAKMPNYKERYDEIRDLGNQADYGLISEDDYFAAVAEMTGLSPNDVRVGLSNHIKNEKLIEYIKELGTKYNIGMISNIARDAISHYFSEDEIKQLFDDMVLSSEIGMIKPHPEIFELAAERLGFDPTECVFVDDIEDNVRGAEAVGMIGIVYHDVNLAIEEINRILDDAA